MKRKTLKIYSKVGGLLSEAMRRIYCLNPEKSIDSNFAGLGSPSMYKDGIKAGFFAPSFPKEIARVPNWYKLTPLGKKIVKQLKRKGRVPQNCHDMNNHVPFEVTVYVD